MPLAIPSASFISSDLNMALPDFDILQRREDKFVLWIPGQTPGAQTPQLILGTINSSTSPAVFNKLFEGPLVSSGKPDLFELDPNNIRPALQDGTVYWYWFKVTDTSSATPSIVRVTDPMAYTVDYSMFQTRDEGVQPASVIKFRDSKLRPCDVDGNEPPKVAAPAPSAIPDNNHLVIYELPVS